jgi:hypothetical protein
MRAPNLIFDLLRLWIEGVGASNRVFPPENASW